MNVTRPLSGGEDGVSAEREGPTDSSAAAAKPLLPNAKGALLEYCQKKKLGTPAFTSTSNRPSNAPAFVCIAELKTRDRALNARSPGASTKRQAEVLAAEALLEQLLTLSVDDQHENPPAR